MSQLKGTARDLLISVGAGVSYSLAADLLRAKGRLPSSSARQDIHSIFLAFPYHSVGDTILCLKLVERVKALWPNATLDFAVGATMEGVIESSPQIRKVVSVPRSHMRPGLCQDLGDAWSSLRSLVNTFAGERYDLAIAPRWEGRDSYQGATLAYASGGTIRCGYDSRQSGGIGLEGRLLNRIALGGQREHESLRFMRLLGRCGLDESENVPDDEVNKVIAPLVEIAQTYRGISIAADSMYAVLAPGATSKMRMWPEERFIGLGKRLRDEYDLDILITGSKSEAALCNYLAEGIGAKSISLAGKVDPLQMVDLMARAVIMVGNDSGPGHIAGGLGVRTVIVNPFPRFSNLDHFNAPSRFRPCGPRVAVVQPVLPLSPCTDRCLMSYAHCIAQIDEIDVFHAIGELDMVAQ